MNVYISADLEGTAGVVAWDQTNPTDKDYDAAVALMVGEVNAAIEGAIAGGATRIVVNDSHNTMRNLRPDALHPFAELVSGGNKPLSMMQGIDESFDAVFFTGYHAMAGDHGVLNHTYWGSVVNAVRLNGRNVGEIGINAAVAGYYGVPVVLVTGDTMCAAEATALMENVETAVVKVPTSRYSAQSVHPTVARDRIRQSAERALARIAEIEPMTLEPPITLDFGTFYSGQMDRIALLPGIERTGSRAMKYVHEDYITVFKCMLAACILGQSGS